MDISHVVAYLLGIFTASIIVWRNLYGEWPPTENWLLLGMWLAMFGGIAHVILQHTHQIRYLLHMIAF
jgi:hypothetical protein